MITKVKTNKNWDVLGALLCIHIAETISLREGSDEQESSSRTLSENETGSTATTEDKKISAARKAGELAAAIRDADGVNKPAEAEMALLYGPGLRRVLKTRTNCREDLEDLVNQVWATVLPKLRNGDLKNLSALPGYLNSFARKTAANFLKKSSTKASKSEPVDPDLLRSETLTPLEKLDAQQSLEIVMELIDELNSERDKQLLIRFLVFEEEKSDLCAEFDLDSTAFNKVLSRARKRLKALLEARQKK